MKIQLNTRQVCFIFFAYTAAGKLLMMPALLSYYCGGDLWLPALIIFLLQGAAVWAVAWFCSRTDKTFFALIEEVFGKTVSKIFLWLFALFFAAAALLPMMEQKLFVQSIFYDTIPSLITFLPFFILSVYAGAKGIKNAGRAAEIALPLFSVALLAIVVMSLGESNMSWLLPSFSAPAASLAQGARFSLYNFSDAAVMLMLAGRFRYKKGDATKITLSYALAGVCVVFFLALFYSIFSTLAPDQYFAVSKIAIFFSALSLVGRVDLVAVYAIELCMLFAVILFIQLSVVCLCEAIGREHTEGRIVRPAAAVCSVAVNAVLLALIIAFNNSYLVVQEVYGRILFAMYIVFSFALPAFAAALAAYFLKKSEINKAKSG